MKKRKISQIIEGYKNLIVKDEDVEKLVKERSPICFNCPLNVNGYCSSNKQGLAIKDFVYGEELRYKDNEYYGCGCYINAKIRSVDSQCPLGKF